MFKRRIILPDPLVIERFLEYIGEFDEQMKRIIEIIETGITNLPQLSSPFSERLDQEVDDAREYLLHFQADATQEIQRAKKCVKEIKYLWPEGASRTDKFELWLTDQLRWLEAMVSSDLYSLDELDFSDRKSVKKWREDVHNYKMLAEKVDKELEHVCDAMDEIIKEARATGYHNLAV
jgi:archaellum component FlaC